MKPIEIVMYIFSILLNIITLFCGLVISSQGYKIGVYSIIFQIVLTIGAVIITFTALILTIMRIKKGK